MTLTPQEVASRLGVRPPTPEQSAVIEAELEPALVVAGAGAGKTATMAMRVAWLVANGLVRPGEILGLTFTRKAAGELAERVHGFVAKLDALGLCPAQESGEELPMPGEDRPEISTYNSYAAAIVRDYGILSGLDPEARLLSDASRYLLAEQIVEEADDLPLERLDRSRTALVEAVVSLSDACSEHLVPPAELDARLSRLARPLTGMPGKRTGPHYTGEGPTNATGRAIRDALESKRMLAPLVTRFSEAKAARRVMDFGDQVAGSARIATALPSIGVAERQRWRVVLLDEYQDTSYSQFCLLRALFAGHPVMAVGDPRQSIYGWRGASAGNIRDFPATFSRTDGRPARTHQLTIGFRNDRAILRAANAIAGRLPGAEDTASLVPRPEAGAGALNVDFPRDSTAEEQYTRLAEWARAQHAKGYSCAVLCRTRGQFEGAEAALRALGVPSHTVGTAGLLSIPEVQDVVAVLTALADPEAGPAAVRLLTSERIGIGAADLAALYRWHRGSRSAEEPDAPSLLEALDDLRVRGTAPPELSDAAQDRLGRMARTLHRLRQRRSGTLVDLIRAVIGDFLLDVELYADPLSPPQAARLHLDAFMQYAAEFEQADARPTLSAFLLWLESARQRDRGLARGQQAPGADAVLLMTIHASKGLEFDAVAIPDCVKSKLPGISNSKHGWLQNRELPFPLRGDREHLPELELAQDTWQELQKHADGEYAAAMEEHRLAEERRLFYVAVTRAGRSLWLGGSWWGGGVSPLKPSPFLVELLEDLGADTAELDHAPGPEAVKPGTSGPTISWPDPDPAPEWLRTAAAAVSESKRRHGDATSALTFLRATDSPEAQEATFLLAERERLRRQETQGNRPAPLRRISPTAMVRLDTDPGRFAEDLLRPMPRRSTHAARVGTAFHAWVEEHYGQAALYELDELAGTAEGRALGAVAEEELTTLKQTFLRSRFAELRPVAVELPFELSIGGIAVPGTIDAVFETPSGYEVVDWKTGRLPSSTKLSHMRMQLAVYRIAFAKWKGLDSPQGIAGTFYYLPEDREVTFDDLPDEAELGALLNGPQAPWDPSAADDRADAAEGAGALGGPGIEEGADPAD